MAKKKKIEDYLGGSYDNDTVFHEDIRDIKRAEVKKIHEITGLSKIES